MVQLLINSIVSFSILLLIGYSFNYVYSTIRFFHLAHAISLTFGAYISFQFYVLLGCPLWLSVIISVAIGVALMLLCHVLLYRPLLKREFAGWKMMVVSLGIYVVLQNIVSIIWGDKRVSMKLWDVSVGHEFLGGYISNVQIITIIVCILFVSLVYLSGRLMNSGKKIQAVASNQEMSSILGISSNSTISYSMAMGTSMMAIAGILVASDVDITPGMGFDWLLYGVVAMIIGGMGKMRYMIFGAFLLAAAQQLSAYYFDSKWMNATAYIILVIFLYFRPFGFSGKKLKKTEV